MKRLSWFLPESALKAFYSAYIATSFDYCSLVWDPSCLIDSTHLQRLQNYACRLHHPEGPNIFISNRGSNYPSMNIPQ